MGRCVVLDYNIYMNSSSRITHHKTKNDYITSRGKPKVDAKSLEAAKSGPEAAVASDVSEAGKSEMAAKAADLQNGKVLEGAKDVAQKVAKAPPVTPLIKAPKSNEAKKVEKAEEIKEVVDRPGIFFIEGLNFFSLVSSDGIGHMANKIKTAENFSWSDTDKILEEIKKRPENQPIILVGHSLGGDTAVEIANELNTVENGFREVDLIVTLDSFGFNNDIIPENVKVNLNFIGDNIAFLNDGANIARDNNFTQVVNELRSEGHRELDDSRNVQFKIFKAIEKSLKNSELNRQVEQSKEAVKESEKELKNFDMFPVKPF